MTVDCLCLCDLRGKKEEPECFMSGVDSTLDTRVCQLCGFEDDLVLPKAP